MCESKCNVVSTLSIMDDLLMECSMRGKNGL